MKSLKALMYKQGAARLTTSFLLGGLTAWLSKDFLTLVVLMGRDFDARSLLVKLALLLVYTTLYAAFLLVLVPKWLDRLATIFNRKRLFYSLLFVCLVLMSYPLLNPGLSSGHDLGYHLLRIASLTEGMRSGQMPVRVNPVFLNGYGYASSLFYPDLFLYIPALLNLAGIGLEAAYKLFLLLIFGLSFISAYHCGRGIARSELAGGVTALVYCLSQYYLQNIYTRSALGEVQAFIFLPLIVYGLYDLIFGDFEQYWLLFIGLTGLFYSHLISLLLAVLVSSLLCLIFIRRIIRSPQKIKRILLLMLLVLGCSIAFWLPMLEQMLTGSFKFMQSTYLAVYSAIPLSVIFANAYTLKGSIVSFGFATLLLCLLWFLALRQPGEKWQMRAMNWCLFIGLALILAASDLFPWGYVPPFLNIIQFPWRLFGLASIFISVAVGLMLQILLLQTDRTFSLVLLVLFLTYASLNIISNSLRQTIQIPRDHYTRAANTFSINNGEWLPVAVDVEQIPTGTPRVSIETGKTMLFVKNGQTLRITQSEPCQHLDLPLIYYLGYAAEIRDARTDQSRRLNLSAAEPNGSIRIECAEEINQGIITVAYRGTLLQKMALAICLLSTALLIIFRSFPNKREIFD